MQDMCIGSFFAAQADKHTPLERRSLRDRPALQRRVLPQRHLAMCQQLRAHKREDDLLCAQLPLSNGGLVLPEELGLLKESGLLNLTLIVIYP
jgi:hypothetical protein